MAIRCRERAPSTTSKASFRGLWPDVGYDLGNDKIGVGHHVRQLSSASASQNR